MNLFYAQIFLVTIFLTLNVVNTEVTSFEETEVELVQILFRHGDRTPTKKSVFDKFDESDWMRFGGFGQLTQKGMNTAFKLGAGLRQLYADFIGRIYLRNEIVIRSTDYDRTIMSAQMVLAGLFEPTDYQVWKDSVKWQPIPVHLKDRSNDQLFYQHNCPKYKQILTEKVYKSDEFLSKVSANNDLLTMINANIGNGSNLTFTDLERLSDSFYIQTENKMALPKWLGKSNAYERIRELGRGLYYFYYKETEQARLVSGTILNEMRVNIQKKLNDTESPSKMYLFSAHDTFVAALARLLDLQIEMSQPNYSSALILELRKSKSDKKRYIRLLWKNNWNTEPVSFNEMSVLSCGHKHICPLDAFMRLTDSLVVSDIVADCKLGKKHGSMLIVYILSAITGLICLIITANLLLQHLIMRRKHARRVYQLNLGENLNLMISDDDLYTNTDDEVYARRSDTGGRHA